MTDRRSILETTLVLLPLQIVLRSVEALLPLLLALWFGRTELTDIYYFAWAVFALAGSVVFSAFQDSAVVPVLAEVKLAQPGLVALVRGSLLAHTVAVGGVLAVAVGCAASVWFGCRYAGEARLAALVMVAPFTLYLVALAVKTFLAAILNAEHRYAPVPVASATASVVAIAVIGVSRHAINVVAVPVGSLAGELCAIAILYGSTRAGDLKIEPTFARPEPVRRIARLVASEIGGSTVTRVNPVVDQLMAGLTGVVGGGTLLKLSGDVATIPTSLLQAAVLPILLTHLSEHFAARDLARLRATVRRALGTVVVILAAAMALFWLVRVPLLRLLFAHGAMDAPGVDRMARILPYYLVGLPAFGALLVLARAHVAIQNSRIMISMGILNATLNLLLNGVFMAFLGLDGIALATSCTYVIVAAVFAVRLHSRLAAMQMGR